LGGYCIPEQAAIAYAEAGVGAIIVKPPTPIVNPPVIVIDILFKPLSYYVATPEVAPIVYLAELSGPRRLEVAVSFA
jgi:hypothetical protein